MAKKKMFQSEKYVGLRCDVMWCVFASFHVMSALSCFYDGDKNREIETGSEIEREKVREWELYYANAYFFCNFRRAS